MQNYRVIIKVAAVLAFMGAALVPLQALNTKSTGDTPAIDADEYQVIMSHRVRDIQDLEDWTSLNQLFYLPILPPVADLTLRQEGDPVVLPFTPKTLPAKFLQGLSGVYEYSVPVYPVALVEDPTSHALTFYNLEKNPFFVSPADASYDPFSFLKERWPWLYTGNTDPRTRSLWETFYNPARIVVTTKLIDENDVERWLYARARVLESEPLLYSAKYSVPMSEVTISNLQFSGFSKVTNGVRLTMVYTNGFTNGLDVFMCNDLMGEVWGFAAKSLPTTGTNLTWVDTNAWVFSGMPVRFYAAADATADADGDGYADGREIMVYNTDPNSATSHPVTVSGAISYGGGETGTIYVQFNTGSNDWSLAKSISMAGPGAYTNDEISNNQDYWFSAFRDVNGSFARDAWEPWGIYSESPTLVTGSLVGVDIALQDVPSVWGQISYTGSATGDIHVIAVTDSNSWDTTYETIIPYIQNIGMSGELYYVTFPVSYSIVGLPASNYWIRAFMDADTNGVVSLLDPSGQSSTNSIPVSNRTTGINVTMAYDSDGDGMPDWWEIQHWANLSQGSGGDPDNDGLTNSAEYAANANPNLADTDGDGMPDKWEVDNNLNPASAADATQDADGDGIANATEYQLGTNPNSSDSDGDGLTDYAEVYTYFNHVDPLDADSDDDGLSDYAEIHTHGTYAGPVGSGAQDSDQDGLSDSNEVARGTNPRSVDSDGDGIDDGYEVEKGWNPLDPATATQNPDGDAFNNLIEYQWDYQPTVSNSAPPTSQKLILCPRGNNAVQHSDWNMLAVADMGSYSARLRVRPFYQNGALAEQRLYHTQSPGFFIDGTAASSVASPINVPASSTAVEYKITSDATARGTNLYFRLTTTNEPTNTKDSARCYFPEITRVNFWGPGSANYVDVYYGQTNTLWIGMPANTNGCRVRMQPYQGPNNLYGIGYFHWTDWILVKVTGSGADPTGATLNTLDWQSAYGVWYNDIATRGIRLDLGSYTFEVGYDMNGNGILDAAEVQETCKVNVLKVESITPDMGVEIDDEDGNPDTRVFVVSTNSGVVTVTADLDPDISESSLPSCMTLVGGQGTAKLQRTIPRTTTSKTVFTFDCCGAASSKTTTVYVCDAKVSLYADEGQRSWNTSFPFFTFDVGHSWWRLDLSSETVEVVPFDLQYPFVGQNGGYWPENPDNLKPLTNYEDDGVVLIGLYNGDGGHTPTGSHTWQLEFDDFLNALEYFKYRALNPGTYNLYSRNCTTEACAVGNEAGISCSFYTPWGFSDWLDQQ